MPGGVELDLVDPVAEAVERSQCRRVLVREAAPLERLTAELLTELDRLLLGEAAAFAAQRLHERRVFSEDVVALERRRLVRPGPYLDERHMLILTATPPVSKQCRPMPLLRSRA